MKSFLALSALACLAASLVQAAPTDLYTLEPEFYAARSATPVLIHRNHHIKAKRAVTIKRRQVSSELTAIATPTASSTSDTTDDTTTFSPVPTNRKWYSNPKLSAYAVSSISTLISSFSSSSASSSVQASSTTVAPMTTTTAASSSSARATSTTVSSSAPAATSSSATHFLVSGSYYPDWNGDSFTPEAIDYSKFNLIYFAFGIPGSDYSIYFTQNDSTDLLTRLVAKAHAAGTKVIVSVGGWTGSKYFSPAVATKSSRQTFANNIVQLIQQFNLDGIDLDWEYPGRSGNGGNIISGNDSANLLIFLNLLRSMIGPDKLITMATSIAPFYGSNGAPLADVSAFGKVLDHILLMNYDVWGSSSTPGPNAPLSNACGNSLQPDANAEAGIAGWINAGFPADRIVLGLPAYGYVSQSSATSLIDKRSLPEDDIVRYNYGRRDWELQGRAARAEREELAKRQELAGAQITLTDPSNGQVITVCPQCHGGRADPTATVAATQTGALPPGVTRAPGIKAATNGDLSQWMGSQIGFNQLISAGAITRTTAGTYTGKNGYVRAWDKCSSTPFIYNNLRNTVVTYDDPESIRIKAQYAKSQNIGGVAFWDMSTDASNYDLMNAARSGFGFTS